MTFLIFVLGSGRESLGSSFGKSPGDPRQEEIRWCVGLRACCVIVLIVYILITSIFPRMGMSSG